MNISEIVNQLTLEEKVKMLSGFNNFSIRSIERFNIPSVKMADGPMGVLENGKSTAFPASIGLSASWNKELSFEVGNAIGTECRAKDIGILLAPGVNIYKYHQNGRNFEYLGEDPTLTSKMVVPYIKGVQETGVIATVKHFVCNNQEHDRHKVSSNVDDAALNEIYFPAFKAAVQEADVKAVMMSYNPINNVQASENSYLMKQMLRQEWGFTGIIMSDWVSVYSTDCLKAGLDLEMPFGKFINYENVLQMLKTGIISEELIDEKVHRILKVCSEAGLYKTREKPKIDWRKHKETAYNTASESFVLLKNENKLLPLDVSKNITIALVGNKCIKIPASGGGAAMVQKYADSSLLEEFNKMPFVEATYFEDFDDHELDEFDIIVNAIGFDNITEAEAIDRSFFIPEADYNLFKKIPKNKKNIVTLVFAGGGIMLDEELLKSDTIMHCWYPGKEGGRAIADALIGRTNPSGKLPFSWEKSLEDSPVYENYKKITELIPTTGSFNLSGKTIDKFYTLDYSEGIMFGNRYFDSENIEPLYRFGYGLSYTEFAISDVKTDKLSYKKEDTINVSCVISNIGDTNGKEVVQLYIKSLNNPKRNFKELKDFKKVPIPASSNEKVQFQLSADDFKIYDKGMWKVQSGEYDIIINNVKTKIIIQY
jgi:beta-glucosidase